uniref:Uncharacterized protein n=1 Tax=viral metagenome TaxID=1070528 RepID=A0A6C0K1B7_9ZZZZ
MTAPEDDFITADLRDFLTWPPLEKPDEKIYIFRIDELLPKYGWRTIKKPRTATWRK